MATRLKLPRTRRDFYKDLCLRDEQNEPLCSESFSLTDGAVKSDKNKGIFASDGAQNGASPKLHKDVEHTDSGFRMVPMAEAVRHMSHFDHHIVDANGIKPPDFLGGEGDFVDMPTTRQYAELDLQEGGGGSQEPEPLLPKNHATRDELDSPTKESQYYEKGEQRKRGSSPGKDRVKKKLSEDFVDRDDAVPATFSYFDVLIYVVSVGSYIADVGSDCWVAYLYYSGGHWIWFSLTVAFITIPAIIMTVFSLKWYIIDHQHDKKLKRPPTSVIRWVSRLALLMLQLAPLLRYIDSLIFGCKSRKHKKNPESHRRWYQLMLYEDTDSCLLRLIECFMEAAPQLVLQLYIMCKLGAQDGLIVLVGQGVATLTSLCSLAWSLTAYHKALRASLPNKEKMTYCGMALQFFWRFFTVASRVIALALFAARFTHWVFVVIASHWMTMFVWIRIMQTNFCDTRLEELGFNAVAAAIYIFCYLNLVEGHTRLRYVLYYCITFLEDGILISVWYMMTHTKYVWYQSPAVVTVFCGYVFGIIFQVVYYLKAHPNNFAQDRTKAIRAWIPIRELRSVAALRQQQQHEGPKKPGATDSQSPGLVTKDTTVANGNNNVRMGDNEGGKGAAGEGCLENITVQIPSSDHVTGLGTTLPQMQPSPESRETAV